MKHLFKKGLSLLLAALMVVSTLPVSALADYSASGGQTYDLSEDADPDVLTPISGQSQNGESSELPEVPDGGDHVGESWAVETEGVTATIQEDGSWEVKVQIQKDLSGSEKNAESGQWWLAIVPDVKISPDKKSPSELWDGDELKGKGNYQTPSDITDNLLKDATGQTRDTHFIVVTSNGNITSDIDGVFTIKNSDGGLTGAGTPENKMPGLTQLLNDLGITDKEYVDVRVFFFAQSATNFIASGTTTYGAPKTKSGIPSTTYLLNKTTNTLTFQSGTLDGEDWNPEGVDDGAVISGTGAVGGLEGTHGKWDTSFSNLTIPIYNETDESIIKINFDETKENSTLNGNTLTSINSTETGGGDTSITGAQADILLKANSSTAGTIVIPIHAVGYLNADEASGKTYDATITILVTADEDDTSKAPVWADEIVFDIEADSDGKVTSPSIEKEITFHWPIGLTLNYLGGDGGDEPMTAELTADSTFSVLDFDSEGFDSYFQFSEPKYNLAFKYTPQDGDGYQYVTIGNEAEKIRIEMPTEIDTTAFGPGDSFTTTATISGFGEDESGCPVPDIIVRITINLTRAAEPEGPKVKVTTEHGSNPGVPIDPSTGVGTGVVELKKSDGSGTVKLPSTSTGVFEGDVSALGLDSSATYDVWVNGFKTGKTVPASEGWETTVTLWKVTVEADPREASEAGCSVALKLSEDSTGATDITKGDGTSILVPEHAKSGDDTGPYITFKAFPAEDWTLRTKYGNRGGNSTNSWTSSPSGIKIDEQHSNPATGEFNANKDQMDNGPTTDVTVKAHFIRTHTTTVDVKTVGTEAPAASQAVFDNTYEYAGAEIAMPERKSATTNANSLLKVVFTKNGEEELDHWEITGGGTLYTNVDDQGVINNRYKVDNPGSCKDATVYFAPGDNDATITAYVKTTTYQVDVTVKKDNQEWSDSGKKVELKPNVGGDNTELKDDEHDGTFTASVPTGTYTVVVDGVETDKTVDVTAGGSATATVNYYTVDLKIDGGLDEATSGLKVNHGTTTDDPVTVSKIFLATEAAQSGQNIAATADNHDHEGSDKKHYRFDHWAVSDGHTAVTVAGDGGKDNPTTFTLPGESTLESLTPGEPITITAHYQEQYKVTVKSEEPDKGKVKITDPSDFSGNDDNGWYVFVDADSATTVKATATPEGSYRVKEWKAEPSTATFAPESTKNVKEVTITPKEDTVVTVSWEADTFDGSVTLVYSDGSTPYDKSTADDVRVEFRNADLTGDSYNNWDDAPAAKVTYGTGGQWTANGLDATATYDVYVNGYKTGATISSGGATQQVKMYQIAAGVKVDKVGNTNNASHSLYVKTDKAPNTGAELTELYVPETTDTVEVTLTAATDEKGFRMNKAGDDPALFTAFGNGTWGSHTVSPDAVGSIIAPNTNETTLTLTGLGSDINQDVQVYANFTSVFTVQATAGMGGTATPKDPMSVDSGKGAEITAKKAEGYEENTTKDAAFVQWSTEDGGRFDNDGSAITNFHPTQNSTVHASFKTLEGTGTLEWTVTTGYDTTGNGAAKQITLTNSGDADTSALSLSIIADGSATSDISAFTLGANTTHDALTAGGPGNTATVDVSLQTGKGEGTYTAILQVTDGAGLTIQLPLKLTVNNPLTFGATIQTFPDGAVDPKGDNIQSVYLVESVTSAVVEATGGGAGGGNAGVWTATGLQWGSTYTVYVNGYQTTTEVNNTHEIDGTHAAFPVRDLYTVQWTAESYDGGAPTATSVVDSAVEGKVTAYTIPLTGGLVVAAGGQVTLKGNAALTPEDPTHYRFGEWKKEATKEGSDNNADGSIGAATSADTTYIAPTETVPNAHGWDGTAKIFLHPTYVQQHKVTFGGGKTVSVDADVSGVTGVTATPDDAVSGTSLTKGNSVYVDVDKSVTMSGLTDTPEGYIFSKWTADPDGGTFGGAGQEATDRNSAKFTPDEDTTLTATYWVKPTRSPATATYDNGGAATENTEAPVYTWTKNDATWVGGTPDGKLEIKKEDEGDGSYVELTELQVKMEETGTGKTFTFEKSYLNTLEAGTYTLRFQSNTPDDRATNHESTPLEATLVIKSTAAELKQVDIKVKGGGESLKVGDSSDKDTAVYTSHQPTEITKENKLTFTWYYADSAPTAARSNNYANAEAAANAITDKMELGADLAECTTDFSAGDPQAKLTGETLAGKYIFAVVEAKNTGKGAVITNAIPVDYDAAVKVTKDGGDSIVGDNYKVYLVPTDEAVADSYTGSTLPGSKVEAEYTTDNIYKTADSALTGGETYAVYANVVEGDKTVFDKVDGQSVTFAAPNSAKVNYYTVTAVPTAQEDVTGAGVEIAPMPETTFTTKEGGIKVDSETTGVLSGTVVTAKASETWEEDYQWNWKSDISAPGGPDGKFSSYDADHQTPEQAYNTTGKDVTVSAQTWVGGQLEQKSYTIHGVVKSEDLNAHLESATLKMDGDSGFSVTVAHEQMHSAGSSGEGVIGGFSFTGVPKGNYTLTAVGKDETVSVLGYAKGTSASEAAYTDSLELDVTETNENAFTIFTDSSKWALNVKNKDNSKDETAEHTSKVTSGEGVVDEQGITETWEKTYAKYEEDTYTVTVTNTGNRALDVALELKEGEGAVDLTAAGGKVVGGIYTSDSGITISGLDGEGKFSLEPEGDKSFTVTIPEGLDAGSAKYLFTFTSKDHLSTEVYGPTVTYTLDLTVKPLEVTEVKLGADIPSDPVHLTAKDLKLDREDPPAGVSVPKEDQAGTDVVYEWYAVPYGTEVWLDKTDGTLYQGTEPSRDHAVPKLTTGVDKNGTEYTIQDSERGKSIYLVAKGQGGNVTSAVLATLDTGMVSPPGDHPFVIPYEGRVTVKENTTQVTDKSEADKYTVKLVPQDGDEADDAIPMTFDDTDNCWKTDGNKLTPGVTYEVYANTVSGDPVPHLQKSDQIITGVTGENPYGTAEVTYYQVTIQGTTYDNVYDKLKGTDFFGTGPDGSTEAPQTGAADSLKPTAKAGEATVNSEDWVQKGTEVDFTLGAWTKDYTLTWTGAEKDGDDDPTGTGSKAKVTGLSGDVTVETELKLNLHDIVAYVTGSGSVDEITLADTSGNTFTSKTDASGGKILATGDSHDAIHAPEEVTFQVPEGTYTATATPASDSTRSGYHVPHEDVSLKTEETVLVSTTQGSFDVVLATTGQKMKVETDGDSAEARYSGSTATNPNLRQTVTLQYGYAAKDDITLTVTNTSEDGGAGSPQEIYDVTMGNLTDAVSATSSENKITVTSNDLSDTPDLTDSSPKTVTITIAQGLKPGNYQLTAKISFAHEDSAGESAYVTYTLNVVVQPVTFESVTMKGASGYLKGSETLQLDTYKTKDNDIQSHSSSDPNYLTPGTDYHYAWYASEDGDIDTVTWTAGSVSFGGKSVGQIGTVDSDLNGETIKANAGKYIYLVIYATNESGKVTGAAISDPVQAGYRGAVRVNVDGAQKTGAEDPGYTVQFVKGENTVNSTWDGSSNAYLSNELLEPGQTYEAKASVSNEGTLLGTMAKVDDVTSSTPITANYYTVRAVETTQKHYADNATLGESFDDYKPKPGLTLNDANVDGQTVLSGQKVDAKFENKESGKGWKQDYTLTWQQETGSSADGSHMSDVTDSTITQNATEAVTTGREWTITGTTYIGGVLNQNTYQVTGSISGTPGTVSTVTMARNEGGTFTTGRTTSSAINPGNSNTISGSGGEGDTITFTVVKGTYTITATAGASTTITNMQWNSDGQEPGSVLRNKDVSANGQTFTVHLAATDIKLTVKDGDTHTATSSTTGGGANYQQAEHDETVYFANVGADKKLELKLTNEGNTSLNVSVTLYKTTKANLSGLSWGAFNFATGNSGKVTQITVERNAAEDGAVTFSSLLADGTLVSAGESTGVDAGTITIKTDAKNDQDQVYILRFSTGGANTATVYYVLNLTVNPLPIMEVTTPVSDATGMSGAGAKLTSKGLEDVKVYVDGGKSATDTAQNKGLTNNDVHLAWVSVPKGETAGASTVLGRFTVSGGKLTTSQGGYRILNDGDGSNTTYTVTGDDMDQKIYLIAYAPNGTVNASEKAISQTAITTKQTAKVQVKLDDTVQPGTGTANPGYTIYLVENSKSFDKSAPDGTTGTWATTWSNNSDKAYQAAIDMGTTYHVYAPIYKGNDTVYVDTGLTVGDSGGDTATVPYWSVKHTANVLVDNQYDGFSAYLPTGGDAANANALQNALTVKISDDKSATYTQNYELAGADVPVLDGMHVKVTVNGAAENSSGRGWDDGEHQKLHTLTATGGWASGDKSEGIDYAATVEGKDITVTSAQDFSASLKQVLFTVKFQVKDETDPVNSDTFIKSATLKNSGGSYTWNNTAGGGTGTSGAYKDGDTVTFEGVPAGELKISAAAGTHTLVKGYKWDGTDVVNNAITVTTDSGKNQNTANNQILIVRGSNKITWKDNFDETSGKAGASFRDDSHGFTRTDAISGGSYRYWALYEGYGDGDGLTYTVQVHNEGSNPLNNFIIKPDTDTSDNFDFDLTKVTLYHDGGTSTADATNGSLTLAVGDYVQFTVTIKTGKAAQLSLYTGKFTASGTGDGEALTGEGLTYEPAYKVNAPLDVTAGGALVHYGDGAFSSSGERTHTDVKAVWPADNGTAHTFTYAVTDGSLPDWLEMDKDTGAITFKSGAYATGVNVQTTAGATNWDDYEAHKVDNERVVNVTITDTNTGRTYTTTYTIDMEPGQLSVEGASFSDPDAEEGKSVDLSKFSYTVKDQADQSVANGDITWSAEPDKYVEGSYSYDFTGAYKAGNATEKWNYKPATSSQTIVAKERTTVTLTYNLNGHGSLPAGVEEEVTGDPGMEVTLPKLADETDYTFLGWSTNEHATAADAGLTGGARYTVNESTTLYAVWAAKEYTYTFYANGGAWADGAKEQTVKGTVGATVNKPADEPTWANHTFLYWGNAEDGEITFPTTMPSGGGNAYAVWERNQSTVKFELAGGAIDGKSDLDPAKGDTNEAVADPGTPKRDGYTFKGWKGSDGNTYDFDPTTSTPAPTYPGTKGDNLTLTADWERDQSTVTFELAGGTIDGKSNLDPAKGDTNEAVADPGTPVRDGYTFKGWKGSDGKTYDFNDADDTYPAPTYPDTKGGNLTLTADWEQDEAKLHYNWGVEGASDVTNKGPVGTPDPNVPSDPPSNPGYVWDGKWYDPEGNLAEPPTFPKFKNDQLELHAGWTKLSVALKFEDVRANAADVRDGGARITLVDPDATLTDMTAATPKAREVTRSGEYVVYLDTVPTYTVTLTNVGDALEGMTLEAETTNVTTGQTYGGFLFTAEEALSALEKDGTYTFTLTPDKLGEGLYAGTYHVKLTATGTAADGVTTAEATYEITFQINKKTITKADVTGNKVTGRTDDDKPGDPDRDLTKPDDKGVIPVTPETKRPNSRTTVTTLKPDPNYEFVDETQPNDDKEPTNEPNYTKGGKGDKDWPEGDKSTAIEKQEDGSVVITTTTSGGGGGGGGGGGADPVCPNQVSFLLGLYGTTKDATMEMVANNGKVSAVPTVSAIEGYKFLGWSQTGPTGEPEADAKRTLVDPKTVTITGDTVFYAVYQPLYTVPDRPFHEHYVIGYPNGNFGPGDNIDRASVATIIARAVLPNFVEGADYGNPLGYSDVAGHWAASAIAYCSKYGVFTGYEDGTFRPSQPISRQELALVMARLNGVLSGTAPFSDIDQAGDWAKDGIYTAYTKGWVNGYTDGTFKPLNPIRRDETVKIFNAYLGRGVDAKGLSALHEYVHSGVASNNTENGTNEYMTWPDVTADQWAYYEIIEAANDHEFATDSTTSKGYTVPETWTKCWIDERWRYHDDPNDGGPALAD